MDEFGALDVVVNNASAILNTPILDTPMKRYDLMQQVGGGVHLVDGPDFE